MPFVLYNSATSEVYSCLLINHYEMEYFGVKYWEERKDAEAEASDFHPSTGDTNSGNWSIIEVPEHSLKLFNVKLKNNLKLAIFWDGSNSVARERE